MAYYAASGPLWASRAYSSHLVGFAASGALVALAPTSVTATDGASIASGASAMASSLIGAFVPVARCLELRDPGNGKAYDVELKTIGSQFSARPMLMRTFRNFGMVYVRAGTMFLDVSGT